MELIQTEFQAIGTHWNIQIDEPIKAKQWSYLLKNIHNRIEEFDATYSRFRQDSLITQISEQDGTYDIPSDGYKLLELYRKLYLATKGSVTPLIGQPIADAGYDATYSFESKTLQHPPHWEQVLSYTEHTITLEQPVLLDFGAAGKGYLVDRVGELIEAVGINSYVIDAGGDILHRSRSQSKLKVGLENPLDASEAIGVVDLVNQSLCASAGSKRKWGKYHHIIDPYTLESPTDVIASWVVAADTMTADGVTTGLFFTGADQLMKHFMFSYALLDKDMNVYYSKDFPVTLFKAN